MVGLKLAIHLLTSVHRYGYFRDELDPYFNPSTRYKSDSVRW